MSKLAERMKELRVENKMKQTEVAKAVGVSISAYCSYEYGNRDPQTATLVALAQLYHVSADYLLGISEPAPEETARIILASNSPRRKELLGQMGIQEFKVSAPNVDESVAEGLSPARIVEELSQRKARAAKKAGPKDIVIAADTVVALDGLVLGKPRSGEDAILEGDFTLMQEGLLRLSFVSEEAKLVTGDQVTTSGLGGVYPRGLVAGAVRSIIVEEDGVSRYAQVEPAADIAGVQYVYVIVDYGE